VYFTAETLYVAVTEQARQAGRLADGKNPPPAKASWQRWPPSSIISARHGFLLPRRPV
jgi:hypothetical protein